MHKLPNPIGQDNARDWKASAFEEDAREREKFVVLSMLALMKLMQIVRFVTDLNIVK